MMAPPMITVGRQPGSCLEGDFSRGLCGPVLLGFCCNLKKTFDTGKFRG